VLHRTRSEVEDGRPALGDSVDPVSADQARAQRLDLDGRSEPEEQAGAHLVSREVDARARSRIHPEPPLLGCVPMSKGNGGANHPLEDEGSPGRHLDGRHLRLADQDLIGQVAGIVIQWRTSGDSRRWSGLT